MFMFVDSHCKALSCMLHLRLHTIVHQALIAWYRPAAEHYRLLKPMDLKVTSAAGHSLELTMSPIATPFEMQQQIDKLGGLRDLPLNRMALIFEQKNILANDVRNVPLHDLNLRSGDIILAVFDNSPEALLGGAFSVTSSQVGGVVGVREMWIALGLQSLHSHLHSNCTWLSNYVYTLNQHIHPGNSYSRCRPVSQPSRDHATATSGPQ